MKKSRDAFRTISEVEKLVDTPAHILRYWENQFEQLTPLRRGGKRRYYRPDDINFIAGLKQLLHNDGMTVKGVKKILETHGVVAVSRLNPVFGEPASLADTGPASGGTPPSKKTDAGPMPHSQDSLFATLTGNDSKEAVKAPEDKPGFSDLTFDLKVPAIEMDNLDRHQKEGLKKLLNRLEQVHDRTTKQL